MATPHPSRPCGRQPQAAGDRATATTRERPAHERQLATFVVARPAWALIRQSAQGAERPAVNDQALRAPKTPAKAPSSNSASQEDDPRHRRRRRPGELHRAGAHHHALPRSPTAHRREVAGAGPHPARIPPSFSQGAPRPKAPTHDDAPCPSEGRPANPTAKFSPTPPGPTYSPARDRLAEPDRSPPHRSATRPRRTRRDRPGLAVPRAVRLPNGDGRLCRRVVRAVGPGRLPRNRRGHSPEPPPKVAPSRRP